MKSLITLLLACLLSTPLFAHQGKVLETMDAGGYTYARLQTDSGEVWLAGPQTKLEVGDLVRCDKGNAMRNFSSRTLDRTFEEIWFVSNIKSTGGGSFASDPHAGIPGFNNMSKPSADKPSAGSISKADHTIAEVYGESASLKGKTVEVRGKVTKVSKAIMGKNWIHLMDGSGESGSDDLTLTSQQLCKVGDVIVAKGRINTQVDVGAGYYYDVLLEDAQITVESN